MNDLRTPLFNFIKLNCINTNGLDIKKATLDGKFLSRLKKYFDIAIFPNFRDVNILGGSSHGASHIAPALAMMNYHYQFGPSQCCIARTMHRYHGMKNDLIEAKTAGTKNILIVHDFLHDKNIFRLMQVCHKFKSMGYNIKGFVALVIDNHECLITLKKEFQAHPISIFNYSDFILPNYLACSKMELTEK